MQLLPRTAAVLLCAALTLAAPRVGAQQITGRIVDQAGQPMAAVRVSIPGTGIGALSQATGRYLLINVPPGMHKVVAERIGYATATVEVTVKAGFTAVQDFVLAEEDLGLDEIVVTGQPGSAQGRATGNAAASPEARDVKQPPTPSNAQRHDFPTRDARPRIAPYVRRPSNTEGYNHIEENEFVTARGNPLSTFAIDVDRASYANVRRFINEGQLPPADAVRIEELVNYFPYEYAGPEGHEPFAVHTEVARAPWNPAHRLVRIGIQGRRVDVAKLPPANLVFLIDVSGSMAMPNKLPLVKQGLTMLVEQLREQDRVAIVVYAGAAGLVLPSTPGSEKGAILAAIEHLEAGGSTAGGAGIELAYRIARRNHVPGGNNRVILATDGDFNVGPSSDAEMIRLIEEKRQQGTFLTVLGFGTGNLQDAKMEQIADHGNGNFAYIDGPSEASKVLVHEMGGTLLTIAKDVKVQVEFNPARVAGYRLIGYENRALAAEDFSNDRKDGGELGAGHSVTALYEVVPVGADETEEVRQPEPLRYQDRGQPEGEHGDELLLVKLRYKQPDGLESRLLTQPVKDGVASPSRELRFAASVAAFGMILRDSPHRGTYTLTDVLRLARNAVGADREGYRADFLELVRQAQAIQGGWDTN